MNEANWGGRRSIGKLYPDQKSQYWVDEFQDRSKLDKVDDEMRRKRDFKGSLYDRELLEKISDGRWCLKEEVITCNGSTYHNQDEFIVKDLITGELIHRNYCAKVITDIQDGLKFETGYIDINNIKLALPFMCKGVPELILNKEVIEKSKVKIVEDYKQGYFILASEFKEHKNYATYQEYENPIHKSKDRKYNLKYGMDSLTYLISEGKQTTWGIEVETCSGIIPSYIRNNFNFKCVYDGSLKDENGHVLGGEYVSNVFKGDRGFEHLKDFLYEASRRCQINNKCSIHVHCGVTPTQEFIVYLYKLCQLVENDMFKIIPQSRRASPHCRPLDKFKFDFSSIQGKDDYKNRIDEYYTLIYQHYATKGIKPGLSYNKLKPHPRGANGKCGYDQSVPRYCWLNLIPAMFQREGSVEVRNRPQPIGRRGTNYMDLEPSASQYFDKYIYQRDRELWRSHNLHGYAAIIDGVTYVCNIDQEEYNRGHNAGVVVNLPIQEEVEVDEKYDAYTCEFRLFPPSLNFSKIKNSIKICMALVYYAENHQSDIQKRDKISLEEVVLAAYPKRGHKLVRFIKEREELFKSTAKSVETNEYKESENIQQSIMESINS